MTAEPPRIPSRPGLSGCIIAMDEEDRFGVCLEWRAFCDEIVVVDSHSKDKTREIAAGRGARVIERDWPGHGAQTLFAIRAAAPSDRPFTRTTPISSIE